MSPVIARLLVIAAALLFSTGGAAIKATDLSGFSVAASRSFIAAIAMYALLPSARRLDNPRVWLVGLAYAGTMILYVVANKLTTAANTIYLQSTAPIYILFAAPLLLGERSSRGDYGVAAVMATGLLILFTGHETVTGMATNPPLGNALALVDGVTWALTLLGLRWLGQHDRGSAAASAAVAGNVLAFLLALPFCFPLPEVTTVDLVAVSYLGLFQIGLAYAVLTKAVPHLRALEVAVLLLLEPVLSPGWAYALHGEVPSPAAVIGGALVLTAAASQALGHRRGRRDPGPG